MTKTNKIIFPVVKSKSEIIGELAKGKKVEAMVENIAHQSLSSDLQDLCQMVYLILLEYDEDKIVDLDKNNQMSFFLARVIINQFRSSNSPFHKIYRKYQERSEDISKYDWSDEE